MRNWRASAAGKETSGTRFLEQQGSWCDRGRARGQRSGGDRREKGLKRGSGQAQELCDLDKEFGFNPVKDSSWRIAGREVPWF